MVSTLITIALHDAPAYQCGPNGEAVSADMPAFSDPDPAEREAGGMRKVWTAIFGGAA